MKSWFRSRARIPPGRRVIAIGDVHGRYDLLCELIVRLEREKIAVAHRGTNLVFLGDLIDRGPQSRQVLHLTKHAAALQPNMIVLKGNHEEVLVDAWRGDLDALAGWLSVGGVETLTSFGVDRAAIDADDPEAALPVLRAAISEEMIAWIDSLPLWWRSGDYLFVHAGIRPGLPIERQDPADLLWIRDEFLDFRGPHEAVVVHGHTVTHEVAVRDNRIGIDTGAYMTDRLTALCLFDTQRRFVSTATEGLLELTEAIA